MQARRVLSGLQGESLTQWLMEKMDFICPHASLQGDLGLSTHSTDLVILAGLHKRIKNR